MFRLCRHPLLSNGLTFAGATPRSDSDNVVDQAASGDAVGKEGVAAILAEHGNEDNWSSEAVKGAILKTRRPIPLHAPRERCGERERQKSKPSESERAW